MLSDIAEALNARGRALGREVQPLERLAQGEDHSKPGGFRPAEGAPHPHRLAGDESRTSLAARRLVFIEHPQHVLGAGHHFRRRHIHVGAEFMGKLSDPGPAEPLLFAQAEKMRVADDPAAAAAEGEADQGALPSHPHGQGPDGVDRFLRMEADAALGGSPRIVVDDAKSTEDTDPPVIHPQRDEELMLFHRGTQERSRREVQSQPVRRPVELELSRDEGVERFFVHPLDPCCCQLKKYAPV